MSCDDLKDVSSNSSNETEPPRKKVRGRPRGHPATSRAQKRSAESIQEPRVVSKSSTRGRGTRGRGRGGARPGRRQTKATQESDALKARFREVAAKQQERKDQLEEIIKNFQLEKARELLFSFANRFPAICGELLEEGCSVQQKDGGSSLPPDPPANVPEWCICTNCRQMPLEKENKCCSKLHDKCLSNIPGMDIVVLDPQVLRVAMEHRNDLLAEENLANDAPVADVHRSYRHAAYRQWVLMTHRKLGAGDRRVIPSCCVLRIRKTYPDPMNVYTGFIASRLN